jgi:hypothetical protein
MQHHVCLAPGKTLDKLMNAELESVYECTLSDSGGHSSRSTNSGQKLTQSAFERLQTGTNVYRDNKVRACAYVLIGSAGDKRRRHSTQSARSWCMG